MRIIFISDIHGIKKNLEHIKMRFDELRCDKIVVLGDLLNGPAKNAYFDFQYVITFLNSLKDKIICMKGNCDLESDLSKLSFKVYNSLFEIKIDNLTFYFNHGNTYNYDNLGNIKTGILIYGHEHIPYIRRKGDVLCINPGSISLPRGEFIESYLVYMDGKFIIYDILDNIIDEYYIKTDLFS